MKHTLQQLLLLVIFLTCANTISAQAQNTQSKTTTTNSAARNALEQALGKEAKINIRGTVYDNAELKALPGAQVKLTRLDSVLVAATICNDNGQFVLREVASGTYRINVSMIGFKAQNFTISLPKKSGNFKVQDVLLKENAALMNEVEVVGQLPEMTIVDDTVVYNADAFKLPEGAVVEDLIKRLPGIIIDDDGNYVFNGKKVSQFLVDGKEFFGNDRDMILKNLPAEIVKQVKAYDKKSDRARVTGIDDGEERTVLDVIIKEDRKKGWFGNVEAGYGTHNRYSGRLNTNYFKGDQKFSIVANGNNSNGNGRTNNQSLGFTMNYEKDDKYEYNGSVTGNFSQGKSDSWTNSGNSELSSMKFNSSVSSNHNDNKGVNAQYRIELRPDSSWNILLRPEASYRYTSSGNRNESAQFEYFTDPETGEKYTPFELNDMYYQQEHVVNAWREIAGYNPATGRYERGNGVNHRTSTSSNNNNNISASLNAQINKRLSTDGRNVTLNLNGSYGHSESEGLNYSQTDYLRSVLSQMRLDDGSYVFPYGEEVFLEDSVYHKAQLSRNPNKNYNMQAQLGYSEPLADQVYLQINYSANFRYQDNQRNIDAIFDGVDREYNPYLNYWEKVRDLYSDNGINASNYSDDRFSQFYTPDTTQMGFTKNRSLNQNANIQIRINRTKYQLTVGGSIQPQYSKTDNVRGYANGVWGTRQNTHNSRFIVNASPSINFRYMMTRQETLNFRYSGSTGQPSINDLVDGVISDTDPLNIRYGNPDLKPSFTHNMNADYSRNKTEYNRTNSVNFQFRTTMNSTAQRTEYNEETGGRVSKPVNVNGNWSGSATYTFNTSLGPAKRWRISNSLTGNFNNNIGYQYNSRQKETVRTRTNSLSSQDRITLTYRYRTDTEWDMEARGNANVRYNANRSTNPNATNMDTWQFGYGLNFNVTTPWGMNFSTDATENSRRGYSNAAANTNKWIWNAQISQRFLKNKTLTLTLRAVDILNQRDDVNRNVGATSYSDSYSQMISSYYMLTANYRFNKFGGRSMNRGGGQAAGRGGMGGFGGGMGGGGGRVSAGGGAGGGGGRGGR